MLKTYLLSALLAVLAASTRAQTLDPTFTPPASMYEPGQVTMIGPAQPDGNRLVQGSFTRLNGLPVRGTLVRLSASGQLDTAFQRKLRYVSPWVQIQRLANGQYLLRGSDTIRAGGLLRTQLLRLNADGSGDATFSVGSGATANGRTASFHCSVLSGGKLLVFGSFDAFNGQPAGQLARLNADGSRDATFTGSTNVFTNPSNIISALAVQQDGKLLLGGFFPAAGGQSASLLLRLNPDGSRDLTYSSSYPAGMRVDNITLQDDDQALVLGHASSGSSLLAWPELVRLTTTGSRDGSFAAASPTFATPASTTQSYWQFTVQPDGRILAHQSLYASGTILTRLLPGGQLDPAFQPLIGTSNQFCTSGLQPDGSIWVGGYFAGFANGENCLGRLSSTGVQDAAFNPRLLVPSTVRALVRQPDGRLLAGGNFVEWNGQPVHRLVRLLPGGLPDASFATGPLPAAVTGLALLPDGRILAGTASGLAALTATGRPSTRFAVPPPLASAAISALAVQPDGRTLVGGDFTGTAAGSDYQYLARLDTTGTVDLTFNRSLQAFPAMLYPPMVLLVQADGKLVAGGNYQSTPGQYVPVQLQRYLPTGALDATFSGPRFVATDQGGINLAWLNALAQQPDGKLLAGGNFRVGGTTDFFTLARFTTAGLLDTTFRNGGRRASDLVASLAVQPNGRVLASYYRFWRTAPTPYYEGLARSLSNGVIDLGFAAMPPPNGTVTSLLVQPDGKIIAAGNFTTMLGQPAWSIARLDAPNVLAVQAPAAVAAATSAWPVPAHEVLRVLPAPTAHPQAAELLDALGRVVRQQALAGPGELSFDTGALPAGLYVLRLRYAEGTVSRQVAVE